MAVPVQSTSTDIIWPSLPLTDWHDTYTTLHLWTQIIGKIQLALRTDDRTVKSNLVRSIALYRSCCLAG